MRATLVGYSAMLVSIILVGGTAWLCVKHPWIGIPMLVVLALAPIAYGIGKDILGE